MPPLLDLSNELLYKIIDHIHPDDILNFSLCRKEIYLLAKDAVSLHVQRKRMYEYIHLFGCHRHEDKIHPLHLVRNFCVDWRVGEYPKHLTLSCCEHPHDPYHLPDEEDKEDTRIYEVEKRENDTISHNTMQAIQSYIKEKAAKAGFLEFDMETVYREAKRGERIGMVTLLLLYVPHLESICLARVTANYILLLEHVIRFIAEQNMQRSPGAHKILMNLSTIDIDGSHNEERRENFDFFILFAALPSVRKIYGDFVLGDGPCLFDWTYPAHTSNVTTVFLSNSAVRIEHLEQLLLGIKSLTVFHYEHNPDIANGHGMQTSKVIAALSKHVSHSLESLRLDGQCSIDWNDDDVDFDHRWLQGFEILKEVFIHIRLYVECAPYPETSLHGAFEEKSMNPLVYVLPPSIETVIIYGPEAFVRASDLLVDLAEEKNLRVPRLNTITLLDMDNQYDEGFGKALKEVCAKVGVTLEIRCKRDERPENPT
ncbi:hypothetical protein IMSHALPRED_003954 [Imshaugia aleurites]|uniref:F-box domain-containing protein n=1 Tax=Imshaugia aleurites TaxID=172621 RepID=A0A8H3HWV5_9LECA|nr:hypothetical protein IMSHALPRED_003954 [Imshaugia aleurites]